MLFTKKHGKEQERKVYLEWEIGLHWMPRMVFPGEETERKARTLASKVNKGHI